MAAGKLSPRQRMINMMYLVLTALLALNVSKDLLRSFWEGVVANQEVNSIIQEKTDLTLSEFQRDSIDNPKKYGLYYGYASSIDRSANGLFDVINEMKYDLVLEVDEKVYIDLSQSDYDANGKPKESADYFTDSEYDKLTHNGNISYLNSKENRNSSQELFKAKKDSRVNEDGRAYKLKIDLSEFKSNSIQAVQSAIDSLLSRSDDSLSLGVQNTINDGNDLIDKINQLFILTDKGKEFWEEFYFYDQPAVGVMNYLTAFQSSISIVNDKMLNFLYKIPGSSDYNFSDVEVVVTSDRSVVLVGDEYKSQIFLSAYDPSLDNKVYVGPYTIDEDGNYIPTTEPLTDEGTGKGQFSQRAKKPGVQDYQGFIQMKQNNEIDYYPFTGSFYVGEEASSVTPTQMNVLYANDIENTIEVSVSGYLPENIDVTFPRGKIYEDRKNGGKRKGAYIVKPSSSTLSGDEPVYIILKVTKDDGSTVKYKKPFRVKSIPGQRIRAIFPDGTYTKQEVKKNRFFSEIPDFDFPLEFEVREFTVVCIGTKKTRVVCSGNELSKAAIDEITKLETGQTVIFEKFVVYQDGFGEVDRPNDKFTLEIKN